MVFKSIETGDERIAGLRSLEIGLTSRCNFRCSYCGAYDLRERRVLEPQELIEAISCLPDLERVKLSGGEVLLEFERCVELVDLCTERGLETQINTNGTLLDPERLERLESAGLGVLHFSLNHTDAGRHSRFYNVAPRMFDRIVANLSLSAASSTIDTVAETILFDETRDQLAHVNRFVAELGVRKHEIQMEIPSVHQGYSNTLSPAEVVESIHALRVDRDPRVTLFFSCLSAYFGDDAELWARLADDLADPQLVVASCVEGHSQLHVHSDGDVLICELGAPETIGNIFETDLLSIYRDSAELQLFVDAKHGSESFSCFRHCDSPGEVSSVPVTLLPAPRVSA